jgi:integrase
MRLKVKDVDLKNQVYKCDIRKGKQHREVLRTIKTIALPLWEEVLEEAKPDDYVFSKGLKPGPIQIRADQITKRWYKYVKKPLGIEATFYSLKHSHTSEIVDLLSEEDAAKLNGHVNTDMVSKVYDVKKKDRQHQRLKSAGNRF